QRRAGPDVAAHRRGRHPRGAIDGRLPGQVVHHVPALILQLSRLGFLVLLWLFILAAIRVIRSDLRVASEGRTGVTAASRRQQRRATPPPVTARPGTMPSMLVVTAGSMAGTRLRLHQGPILIGRAEDSTLVL